MLSRCLQERDAREARTLADYQKTLERLGLGELRQGADGWNRNAPNSANFDDAGFGQVPPLPALMTKEVKTAKNWPQRRAEIANLLEREVYGGVPASAPRILWEVVEPRGRMKAGNTVVTTCYVGRPADSFTSHAGADCDSPGGG